MLDPQIFRCIALGFGLLFILASAHKLGDRTRFRAIVSDYRVMPAVLVPAVAFLIPVSELLAGSLWVVSVFVPPVIPASGLFTCALLTVYGLAISVNLTRGRTHIDCGCSFSSGHGDSRSGQLLSVGLVVRNLSLAVVSLVPLLGVSSRALTLMDHGLLLLITLTLLLFYAAFNQLLVNQGAIASWRNARG
jgi:hypothetical protein